MKPKVVPIVVPLILSPHNRASNLAKFDLPEFCGDILLWLQFWDIFSAEVDQNPSFSGATKFNYVNAKLKEKPKQPSSVSLPPTTIVKGPITKKRKPFSKRFDVLAQSKWGKSRLVVGSGCVHPGFAHEVGVIWQKTKTIQQN